MQKISLDRNSPNAFVLVTDGNFSKVLDNKDQVWTVNLNTTDPHPFCLETTYGLRAKSMRLFPNFIYKNQRLSKPEDFASEPKVISYTPSSAQIMANFQDQISFLFTFFLPEPEVLVGIIKIDNLVKTPIDIILQLAVNLVPMGKGKPSYPDKIGKNQFLTGKTDQLQPILFMTGGPSAVSNPFPALSIPLRIKPESSMEHSWSLVSKETESDSFEKAKQIITTGWQDGYQKHIMHHEGQTLKIKTGDPDWDAAFYLSQVNAQTHLLKSGHDPEKTQFIKIRLPDQPANSGQERTDKNLLTNLERHHLSQIMLPANAEILLNLLDKKIKKQVDSLSTKPRSIRSECPLLASSLLEIFEITGDVDILEQHYQNLILLFQSWVTDPSTGGEDVFLHWDNPTPLQLDTGLFTYDVWEANCKGLDIKKVESPALYAFLLKEAKALQKISKIINKRSQSRFFNDWQKEFYKRLESCWRDDIRIYGYKDIESHLCTEGEIIYQGQIKKHIEVNRRFSTPQRLICHINAADHHTRVCIIRIKGKSGCDEDIEEVFKTPDMLWVMGQSHLTTEFVYKEVNSISFEGLKEEDSFLVETANYTQCDITCLLPLWAGTDKDDHIQELSAAILNMGEPALSYGIPETWAGHHPLPENLQIRVNIMWNTLILEGLVNQGKLEDAAKFFTKLMTPIIKGLKDYDGFFPLFDSKNGNPFGQQNAITGLVSHQLFLKIAGIKILSPQRVVTWGDNPFPWPIEVFWKGLSLWKDHSQTRITFPKGTVAEYNSNKVVLITSE